MDNGETPQEIRSLLMILSIVKVLKQSIPIASKQDCTLKSEYNMRFWQSTICHVKLYMSSKWIFLKNEIYEK